jgi:hypothetical protein
MIIAEKMENKIVVFILLRTFHCICGSRWTEHRNPEEGRNLEQNGRIVRKKDINFSENSPDKNMQTARDVGLKLWNEILGMVSNKICKVREILSETDIIFRFGHLNCVSHRLINTVSAS